MFETLRKQRMDPEAEREIAVIDLAVANGDTGRPEDADLTDFAMKLRGTRPLPDVGEITRLDTRVAHFGDSGDVELSKPRAHRPRKLALAGLAAVCVFGAAAVTVSTLSGGPEEIAVFQERAVDNDISANTDNSPSSAAKGTTKSAQAQGAAEARTEALAGADSATRVETRNTTLTLAAPVADVEDVSDDVIAATDRYGGYVTSSSVDVGDDDAEASLELMIPAADYQSALAAISGLAHVRERVQNTEDITTPYRRAETSLDRAIKYRDRLSRQRKAAETVAERDALTVRLRRAIRRVAAERAQFNALERQASYVAMSVSIVGDDAAAKSDESTIGAAWRISKDLLTTIAGALIVIVAVLLPFTLLAMLGFIGARALRRRRQDSVLDASASGVQSAR